MVLCCSFFFFFQAEDGIRDLVRSRGLGDVYKRQNVVFGQESTESKSADFFQSSVLPILQQRCYECHSHAAGCLLYTSDAADERSSVDLGGRRIIKKKKKRKDIGMQRCRTWITRH